ncbi:MAG: OmpA family protein [Proteobacteria bacterium]|nr:OmpA family protein [Pseudomonadota bacterium]
MHSRILLIISCLIVMVLSACFLNPNYKTLEAQLEDSRIQKSQTENRLEYIESELSQTERRLQLTAAELKDSEEARNKYAKDVKDFEAQSTYLKNINLQLSENLKILSSELNKKKSVIELQEKVIQLLDDTKKTIETSLKDQIAAQEVEVIEAENKLKVIFLDKILFDSGSAEINPKGKELLRVLAGSLKENKNQNIVIEGHTDNVSLTAYLMKRFPSNWELSTARASAVAHFFQEEGGIDPLRLSPRGYSFYRPVAPNDTAAGRRQNRRIEIVLGAP